MNRHTLPDLPWDAGALAPQMSAKTLELHHGKHHAAYVEKLNKLIKGTEFADMALEDIIMQAEGPIFNNAAQHWNHSFFWRCLRPACGTGPSGDLLDAIDSRLKSFEDFKAKFTECAVSNFGSGWTWLVADRRGGLDVINTANAANPLREDKVPLLACDVWEHAYYVDYQNRRPDYLAAFWELVDWERVAQRHGALARKDAGVRDVSAAGERSTRA